MANKYFDTCKEVNSYWGEKMPMMTMEELAELAQAISKLERKLDDIDKVKELRQNVIDEIGDVAISCHALMHRYGIKPEEIEKRINEKLGKKY